MPAVKVVKVPAAAVVPPMMVLSMTPPLMVKVSTTSASWIESAGTWMLNRWFSMHPDYLEIIAECQSMTDNLSPELFYKFYSDLLPKKKFFTST